MLNNDKILFGVIIGLAFLTFILGFFYGKADTTKQIHAEAISNGVARYEIVDKKTGKVEFKWNTQSNMVERN